MPKRPALQPEPSPPPRWLRWPPAAWAALLVVFALIAYSNSFAGPFIFDDLANVTDNAKIRHLWPVWETMRAPLAAVGMAGRPVAQLSLAINYAIHGLGVVGYHVGNLVLHVITALVLFGVVRRTLTMPALAPHFGGDAASLARERGAPAEPRLSQSTRLSGSFALPIPPTFGCPAPLAFAVALMWEVHPLLCDSVSYVSARTEMLAGLFLLLTLYCAIRAMSAGSTRGVWAWRVASVTSCALGTGSKEVMVAAPVVVLTYDWLFARAAIAAGQRPARPSTRDERHDAQGVALRLGVLYYLALFATLTLVPLNLTMSNFHRSAFARVQDQVGTFDYLKLQSQVIVHYLRLTVWPEPLLIDYSGEWGRHPSFAAVIPYAALVLILLAITGVLLARRKPAAMLGVWFFAILAPTSSFLPLPTEIASERRMYLPLIAIVALVVLAVYRLLMRLAPRRFDVVGAVVVAVLVAAETSRTLQRNAEFKDPVGLWADVLVRQPTNRRAYSNLAKELLNRNEQQAAAGVYRKMLALEPNDPATWNNLATIAMRAGDWPEAERCLRAALSAKADFALAHQNLGLVYLKTNRFDDAEREVREAIRLDGERADRSAMLAEIGVARGNSGTRPTPNSRPSSS